MKNKCKICGKLCRIKYCADCREEQYKKLRDGYAKLGPERKKLREPTNEKFYVFYDKNDFVRYFGTAKQLVGDGISPTIKAVHVLASKINAGKINGKVLILRCEG